MPIQHSALIIQHFCNQTCPDPPAQLSPSEDSDSVIRRRCRKKTWKTAAFSPVALASRLDSETATATLEVRHEGRTKVHVGSTDCGGGTWRAPVYGGMRHITNRSCGGAGGCFAAGHAGRRRVRTESAHTRAAIGNQRR